MTLLWRQRNSQRLRTLKDAHGRTIHYTLRVPEDDARSSRPLVVALHYRWERGGTAPRGLGGAFLDELIEPALRGLGAVFVAPDCPGQDWTDPISEQAVLAIVHEVCTRASVDPSRVVVVGFSLGAAGAWHLLQRHPDVFSAAVVVAGTPPPHVVERLDTEPVFAINSRADTAASLHATADAVRALQQHGARAELVVLEDVTHLETALFIEATSRAAPWLESSWRSSSRLASASPVSARAASPPGTPSNLVHATRSERVAEVRAQFSEAQELLTLCARTSMPAAAEARVAALAAGDLDWPEVFAVAERHGVAQLLYWHLGRVARVTVPAPVLEHGQRAFFDTFLHNGRMSQELIRLSARMDARGIRVIPFKGPMLAAAIYGDLSLRRFVDLDLIVRSDDLGRAARVLIEEGYRALSTPATDPEERYHVFVHDDINVRVDLQSAMTGPDFLFSLESAERWRSLEPVALGQARLQTFSTADLFIVLCVHGSKHCWSRLMWIVDVAELLRARADADWPRILEHARSVGVARMVAVALVLTRDLLGTRLPHPALDAAADDPGGQALAVRMAEHLFSGIVLTRFETMQMYLAMKDGWLDRLRFCLHWTGVPLDPDLESSVPRSLLTAHYLVTRLRRLLRFGVPVHARRAMLRWLERF